jgi:hypothetical protein
MAHENWCEEISEFDHKIRDRFQTSEPRVGISYSEKRRMARNRVSMHLVRGLRQSRHPWYRPFSKITYSLYQSHPSYQFHILSHSRENDHGRILLNSFTYIYRLKIIYIHLPSATPFQWGITYPKQPDSHVSQMLPLQ